MYQMRQSPQIMCVYVSVYCKKIFKSLLFCCFFFGLSFAVKLTTGLHEEQIQ